ncbi:hypothetical protein GSI_12700 [Ganoderma sinense ZZ0214-1]|uniref:Fungal lipase-type domain-containing protein n=1 Tax=Ganoderma sinense ZZ0214-1 TaxID=1077348 RepID=A0A2G8RTK6_9APHY|nr:hypothetical protein GSI_12700 [Ganoderma sinense ZZ0214-1]
MTCLCSWLRIATSLLAASQAIAMRHSRMKRASVTRVSQSQMDSLTPVAHYASASYCAPSSTLAWDCTDCQANPSFHPIAAGGNSFTVQYWFVGYDPSLESVVVSVQGTKPSAIIPLLTDGDIELANLDPTLFPGLDSSIQAHQGFADAHSSSAADILAAVQQGLNQYSTSKILLTGHSLGAAITLLHSIYIPLHIPGAQVTYVGFGLPRVGDQAFADYVDAHAAIAFVTHVSNKEDWIPIVPGRMLGFHHPSGEIHIQDSGEWMACPGQDNTDARCTVGDVRNLLLGSLDYHDGPYNGVHMGC